MLKSPGDVVDGQTVYLVPATKMCGQWCWMRKVAVVDGDPRRYWPIVMVTLTHQGQDIQAAIDKDNINLRPNKTTKQEQKDGDRPGGTSDIKVKVMPGRPVAVVEDQMELW